MSEEHEFRLEEYRHISAAIIDLDNRIMTVFGLSVAAAGALLGVAASAVFAERGPAGGVAPLALAYWSMLPAALVVTALWVQLRLRRDIVRLGMYRKVFFEQDGVSGLRWESALAQFRLQCPGETNDPIPAAYCLIALASIVLFYSAAQRAGGAGVLGWGTVAAVALVLAWLCLRWLDVIDSDVGRMEQVWQRAKADLRPTAA